MSDTEFLLLVRGPPVRCRDLYPVRGHRGAHPGDPADRTQKEPRRAARFGRRRRVGDRVAPLAARRGTFQRSGFTIISGYVFHIGLFVVIFLFVPHILVFERAIGLSWAGLPSNIVDATTVVTIIALLAVLIHRITDPVRRLLSTFHDYLVWVVTVLPLITGYLAFHRIGVPAPSMLAVHILTVELLMVLFPFTKLMHAFTLWISRWYNGAVAGYKGVRS